MVEQSEQSEQSGDAASETVWNCPPHPVEEALVGASAATTLSTSVLGEVPTLS